MGVGKNYLKKLINTWFYLFNKKNYEHMSLSFSQEGEDRILEILTKHKNNGFYVDVGAHHPQRFSNTYLFYLKGWRGLNIDAMPNSMELFNNLRERDINLEIAISLDEGEKVFFTFDEPALNTLSSKVASDRNPIHIQNKIHKVQSKRLESVLNEHIANQYEIDFLNIDVEGYDLEVLQSNNWKKYRPNFILVEDYQKNLTNCLESDINKYLESVDYEIVARTFNTSIYKNKKV